MAVSEANLVDRDDISYSWGHKKGKKKISKAVRNFYPGLHHSTANLPVFFPAISDNLIKDVFSLQRNLPFSI